MSASTAIAERAVQDIYPLSPLQRGLLFESMLGGRASGMYFVQSRFRLSGQFDRASFAETLEKLMARHQALRTGFSTDLAAPLQIVYSGLRPVVHFEDLRAYSRDAQQAEVKRWLAADIEAGFDLEDPPLWRCAVLALANTEHLVVFSFHHIIMDGTSFAVLFEELMSGYRGSIQGRPATFQPAAQFRDYIAWLSRQDAAESEAYWRAKLADVDRPTLLQIADELGAADEPERTAPNTLRLELSAELSNTLRGFAKDQRLTLNTVLQGAFGIVLGRYCQQTRVCFGVSVSTRPPDLPRADSIVGLMINTVPRVLDVPDAAACDQWLHAAQTTGNEILQYSHSSLPLLSTFARVAPGQPLFNTLFVLEAADDMAATRTESCSLESLVVSDDQGYREQTEFALALAIVPAAVLRLQFMFDTCVLDEDRVRAVADSYVYVLEQMMSQPAASLGSLNVVRPQALQVDARDVAGAIDEMPHTRWREELELPDLRQVTQLYLLDQSLRPVPPGVAGDAWLGGAELARRELRTLIDIADHLRENPFRPGECMYFTGSRARRSGSGRIVWETAPPPTAPESAIGNVASIGPVLPRTPTESTLARIWCEILGRAEVSIDEDFFAAGGDSIGAMRVVAAAQQQSLPVSLRVFIKLRTIRALAIELDAAAQLRRVSAPADELDASMETGVIW